MCVFLPIHTHTQNIHIQLWIKLQAFHLTMIISLEFENLNNFHKLSPYNQGAICRWGWWGFPPPLVYTSYPLLNYFYPRWGQNLSPHPKCFNHYIVIINNQNTQGPWSFWLCCAFDLPGASQRFCRPCHFSFRGETQQLSVLILRWAWHWAHWDQWGKLTEWTQNAWGRNLKNLTHFKVLL